MQEISIDRLEFSKRTSNCLKKTGIFFLNQVMELTIDQMSSIRNMGAKSIQEVLDFQERMKQSDGRELYSFDIETERNEEDKKNAGPVLMIHKAFPHFYGKTIIDIAFKDQNGLIFSDRPVSEIEFSVRTGNGLRNNNVNSVKELAMMKYSQIVDFKNMGSKSVNELITYLRESALCTFEGQKKDTFQEDVFSLIAKQIKKDKQNFDVHSMERVIKVSVNGLEEKPQYSSLEELDKWLIESGGLMKIVQSSTIIANIEQYLSSMFFTTRNKVYLSTIEEDFPEVFIKNGTLSIALERLLDNKKIEKIDDGYRKYLPNVDDWMDIISENERRAISLRLKGETLEECGQQMGITRERVRQLVVKAIRKKPLLQEDEYAYWYCEYALDFVAMQAIFDIDEEKFFYLTAVYKCGDKTVEDMLEDNNLNSKIYQRLFRFINRNSILIGDKYVPCKRELLCHELAKEKYSHEEGTFDDFYEDYLQLLRDNEIIDNPKLTFPSERAFEARLQDSQYILMKYGRRFRYYPINEYDIDVLVQELHLEQFSDVEISTLKLFNEHKDVMSEFDIQDEYELHNLLKKTESIWNNQGREIVLTRMPLMSFGTVDRAKQTEDLLFQIAPVTMEEFGQFYELEYGVLARTAIANMSPYISNYYYNGVYKIDQPLFTSDEYDFMNTHMKDDFYFIEDIKSLFVNQFGSNNLSHVNARTMKELGYRVYTNYIVSGKYSSADEYFTKLIMKNPVVDLNQWDARISYIQQAWVALDTLRYQYDVLEFEDKKYIRYDHFSNMVNYLSKKDLLSYVDDAIRFADTDEYFSIRSLRNKGFESEIHNLGFSDWFGGALVKNSRKVRYIKAGGTILFYKGTVQHTTADFFRYIMKKIRKMDIELFMSYLTEEYGLTFSKEKALWIVKNSEMYYDSIMEKIYYDKEDYYDDI